MSIEYNPVGVKCNLSCDYCYEQPLRDAGNFSTGYDLSAAKEALLKEKWRFSLFGGEPLLMPIDDLEEIFRWGLEQFQRRDNPKEKRFGPNGIQTNGTLITERHIEIFRKYRVHVGLSMDGPDELNDSRWHGTLGKTREATAASEWALRRLCEVGMPPSLIVTLYRGNAVGERLRRLCEWFEWLDEMGVTAARIHLLEIENADVRKRMGLSDNENIAAMQQLAQLEQRLPRLRFDIFSDMTKLLLGRDGVGEDGSGGVACIWNACDPYTTRAVRGIDGTGNNVNCGRTNKDGVDFGKANAEGFERQLVLHETPQADGGCQGCRFFFACKGQCPGTAIDGDWRNRTEQCQVWFRGFERIELDLLQRGETPLSRSPRLPELERTLIGAWEKGINLSVQRAVAVMDGAPLQAQDNQDHADHWDAPDGAQHSDGGLEWHGDQGMTTMHHDVPHGDSDA